MGRVHHWLATINGPADSPYVGGFFKVDIVIPSNYPFGAPKFKFVTPVYHPNVSKDGSICIPELKEKWVPAMKIITILKQIKHMLLEANPDDPLEAEIAIQYREHRDDFNAAARAHTATHAMVA